LKQKCKWLEGSMQGHAQHESLEVMHQLAQSHEHMAKTQEDVVRSQDNMAQALDQLALAMERSHITLLGGEESDMDLPMHEDDIEDDVKGGGSPSIENEDGSTSGNKTEEEGEEEVEMVGRRSKKWKFSVK